MSRQAFTQDLALLLLDSPEQFPVEFDLAWKWLGFSRKDNAKTSLIDCGFTEGIDLLINQESDNHAGLSPQEKAVQARKQKIWLTVDCFKTWGMMANTEQGKQVRKYFLQCEKVAKQKAVELLNHDRTLYNELAERIAKLETQPKPALPLADVDPVPQPIEPLTERACINRLIRSYVHNQATSQPKTEQDVYRWMYLELKYRYHYDVYARVKKSGLKNKLDQIAADEKTTALLAICNHFLNQ
jgi:phage anti-repressor protein